KDEKDDLAREVERKLDKGYPRDNIIFQAPERAILYQSGARIFDDNITRPEALVSVVNQFFDYKAPHIQEWEEAVRDFSERIPELATAVTKTIDAEKKRNPAFVRSFEDFYALCKQAINPNLSEEAVERMLVQHLLTERIFRKIFDNPDFTRRNVVAAEIEKVIAELTKRSLNRDDFLRNLERFYRAIERSAEETTNFSEKQAFLNKVYERFFQGYSPKEADTDGIVYTPQPIVNFMVRSVEEILQKEFGRSLGDKGVHILDPFVGTGNFIVRMMQEIKTTDLPYKYENELHCNEVMLLPYYIASMNIEHAYFDRVGEYKPFPGICLVDTFELAEAEQSSLGFMNAENAERVKRQKASPIFVIIGNPPYNANQQNEDDNNKNRKYQVLDRRIAETYAKDSEASNRNSLSDPYVKAIRWASDRIGEQGIVAFITNRSFADAKAFDAVRQHLATDFSLIYHLNLKGDARTTGEMRRRQAGNVFDDGIRVGVGVTLFVRRSAPRKEAAEIHIAEVDDYLTSQQKRV
ncbi:MAG: DNA helicase, partial [Acidobacteria bacterium]